MQTGPLCWLCHLPFCSLRSFSSTKSQSSFGFNTGCNVYQGLSSKGKATSVWSLPHLHLVLRLMSKSISASSVCFPGIDRDSFNYFYLSLYSLRQKWSTPYLRCFWLFVGRGNWDKCLWTTCVAARVGRFSFLEDFKKMNSLSNGSHLHGQLTYNPECMKKGVMAQADGECRYVCCSVVFLKTLICIISWVHQFYSI